MRRYVAAGILALALGMAATGLIVSSVREAAARSDQSRSYRQDLGRWRERLAGCERTKTDRTATAVALRAQSVYLNLVLGAASVKQDVKDAALVAQRAFDRSAGDLESRTGQRLDCRTAYPRPVPPDGVPAAP